MGQEASVYDGQRVGKTYQNLDCFVINTQYFKIQKILKELGVSMVANTCNHRTGKAETRLS